MTKSDTMVGTKMKESNAPTSDTMMGTKTVTGENIELELRHTAELLIKESRILHSRNGPRSAWETKRCLRHRFDTLDPHWIRRNPDHFIKPPPAERHPALLAD